MASARKGRDGAREPPGLSAMSGSWLSIAARVLTQVSCDDTGAAKKVTSGTGAQSSQLAIAVCAASGLALVVAGYHYWVNSETDENEGSAEGKGRSEEDQAGAEAALEQARVSLNHEWTQASELHKASKGTLGFEAWWSAADGNSKKALLQSARDLMRQRLQEHQPDAAVALDVLCPEIGDSRLDRLVRGNALVALIKLRISQLDAVRRHDITFVKENLAQQNLDGKIQGVDAVEVLCDNRQLLMMTFLCDVLILCRHMGNFPKMLSEDGGGAEA